jgi:hypothetical protein
MKLLIYRAIFIFVLISQFLLAYRDWADGAYGDLIVVFGYELAWLGLLFLPAPYLPKMDEAYVLSNKMPALPKRFILAGIGIVLLGYLYLYIEGFRTYIL